MTAPDLWTLDQLTERVAAALAVDYPGQVSGRVREVPDRRAIRWYTTIGLVDRPAAMRGRTALYAERHLLQLVAIKRRQADGCSLAEIQAELAGATDAMLRSVARIPPLTSIDGVRASGRKAGATPARAGGRAGGKFWAARPAAAAPAAVDSAALPAPAAPPDQAGPPGRPVADVRAAIRLPDGVTVLLPCGPGLSAADVAAVSAAAAPLLAELRRRGLTANRDSDSDSRTHIDSSPADAGSRAHRDTDAPGGQP